MWRGQCHRSYATSLYSGFGEKYVRGEDNDNDNDETPVELANSYEDSNGNSTPLTK